MNKLLIIGGGSSGLAAERLGKLLDFSTSIITDNDTAELPESDLIVASPGVHPLKSHLYKEAIKQNRRISSELLFGFKALKNNVKVLAITGTNGKTTTTELTVHLLNAMGIKSVYAGNIGVPLSDVAADILTGQGNDIEVIVTEVSSFQLELAEGFAPYAAVLLNLKSDHEERYPGGFEEYCRVKRSVFDLVAPENRILGMRDYPDAPHRVVIKENKLIADDTELVQDLSQTALSGAHNRENLVAATELLLRIIPAEKLKSSGFEDAVKAFSCGKHRIELVAEKNGIKFINDSKATNPSAVMAAIEAVSSNLDGKIILMLGGSDKGMNFDELSGLEKSVRAIVIFGAARMRIKASLPESIKIVDANMDFKSAIVQAAQLAQTGDAVLLSPACASFDMFKSYEDRGNQFRALVMQL